MTRSLLRPRLLAVVAAAACLVALVPAVAQPPANAVNKMVLQAEAERIAVIKKVSPAVVAVCIYGGQAVGSGVVIDPEGYALTNHHVVQPTGPIMQCGLADGVLYDAVLVGQDRVGDVALIKLLPKTPGKPFPFVALGDSDKVQPGDWSLAMGNPFSIALDFTPTVTYGLVSGTHRYEPMGSKPGISEYTDCIQVDTSINPGNSGGPLFNMKGELIGINGRINFERRFRVNVGVGYAISINQIKNFMGHFRAGIETDHANPGASVGTDSEDGELNKMVVREILEDADAFRRGLRRDDQVLTFAGRSVTSTNQYKNVLGIYPGGWRVPLEFRGVRPGADGKEEFIRKEILVRLQGVTAASRAPMGVPKLDPRRPTPKGPKTDSPAAKMYERAPGFTNMYFNKKERDALLAAVRKHGDLSAATGAWIAEGKYAVGDRQGDLRIRVNDDNKDGTNEVTLKLNIEHQLDPLKKADLRDQQEPLGSGGLMMALYHYHRFLALGLDPKGPTGFEGGFTHGGVEPYYPLPTDGVLPKNGYAALRVDTDVIRTKHGPVECKWYFDRKDHLLLGFETFLSKDADPCEVYLSDYKAVDGRMLPHRMEVRWGDRRYGVLTINKYTLAAK